MPNSSDKPRYTLHYPLAADPEYSVRFASLDECVRHIQGAVLGRVRIYDRLTDKHGTLFPSGRIRWNG